MSEPRCYECGHVLADINAPCPVCLPGFPGPDRQGRSITPPEEALESMGYHPLKTLDTGEIAGVQDYLFTAGLVIGLDRYGWRTRFCYERRAHAEAALAQWNGGGDPPGPWIKQKPEDRHNPAWPGTGKRPPMGENDNG